ncbi:hypothetical protein BIFGAL_02892 [Bifidobacterium gallicum DSM 20093 = LMG 11596]|uniref:Uncharacterized protein n=1 Tax=Bifidobacterium gallicum DSM 20093 = LMG 11596 TaxID=561180 RepID=D1NSY1_9BIFI|nr:hypothetical protein BIFGAL_02892 [Bifidobacterium gallicum DSM 20093 = LMG 11596]
MKSIATGTGRVAEISIVLTPMNAVPTLLRNQPSNSAAPPTVPV